MRIGCVVRLNGCEQSSLHCRCNGASAAEFVKNSCFQARPTMRLRIDGSGRSLTQHGCKKAIGMAVPNDRSLRFGAANKHAPMGVFLDRNGDFFEQPTRFAATRRRYDDRFFNLLRFGLSIIPKRSPRHRRRDPTTKQRQHNQHQIRRNASCSGRASGCQDCGHAAFNRGSGNDVTIAKLLRRKCSQRKQIGKSVRGLKRALLVACWTDVITLVVSRYKTTSAAKETAPWAGSSTTAARSS